MKNTMVVGDLKVCVDSANQFFELSKKCMENGLPEYLDSYFYPYAVNVSLACELYLKAILIHRSNKSEYPKGHDLKELFDHLNASDSNCISVAYKKIRPTKMLDDFLDKNRNTFIDWRYALEKPVQIDLSGFDAFSEVLNTFVKSL